MNKNAVYFVADDSLMVAQRADSGRVEVVDLGDGLYGCLVSREARPLWVSEKETSQLVLEWYPEAQVLPSLDLLPVFFTDKPIGDPFSFEEGSKAWPIWADYRVGDVRLKDRLRDVANIVPIRNVPGGTQLFGYKDVGLFKFVFGELCVDSRWDIFLGLLDTALMTHKVRLERWCSKVKEGHKFPVLGRYMRQVGISRPLNQFWLACYVFGIKEGRRYLQSEIYPCDPLLMDRFLLDLYERDLYPGQSGIDVRFPD